MDSLNYNSVEALPGFNARAAFQVNSASVFREDVDISFEPLAIFENPENKKTARCYVAHCFCGVSEIRTRDTLLAYTRFPGVPLQPLEHLSFLISRNLISAIFVPRADFSHKCILFFRLT